MSYAARSSHSEIFPIFNGNDYLYWKERMRIRIQAINYDLWQIVEDGYTIQQQNDLTSDDKANLQLDAQAKDIICGSLPKDIFFRFHRLNASKQIWDALNSAHEEFIAQSDPHTKMLQAMFTGFRSLRKESAM